MYPHQPAPPPEKKKGLSGLAIALIVIGVVCVLGIGTCLGAAVWVGHKAKEMTEEMADGGLVLVSPPEVQRALAGEKKDYVGSWSSERGSTLDIQADGTLSMVIDEGGGTKEKLTNIAIAAFHGDDIEVRPLIKVIIEVKQPPHRVGDHWEMTAKGVRFRRD